MSVGHCGFNIFCKPFSGQNCFRLLGSTCHRIRPRKQKKNNENCIRYVDFVPKSHVPFRPPSHPLRSLNSLKASGGLSLSLSFSRTMLLGEGPQVAEKIVAVNPPEKKFESLGRQLSFSKRSAGFEVYFRKGCRYEDFVPKTSRTFYAAKPPPGTPPVLLP